MASAETEPVADIEAAALIDAPPEDVFDFLSDLGNHWRVADRFVEVLSLGASDGAHADSGRVRVRGPLGLGRTATTRVAAARAPRLIIGTAEMGESTRARVSWILAGRLGSTRVRLAAEIENASSFDRLVLALGGRWWLRRRFASTLDRLAREMGSHSRAREPDRSALRSAHV